MPLSASITFWSDEDYDYDISESVAAHPGLSLYSLSKGVGQEICRVFSENHPIHVILCLFLSFPAGDEPDTVGQGTNAFSVTFADVRKHKWPPRCRLSVHKADGSVR